MKNTALPSLIVLGLLAGCAPKEQPPAPEAPPPAAPAAAPAEPLAMEQAQKVTATVESVDVPNRLVSLKNADGEVFTVEVGPEVQNLPQVKVGDTVAVTYYQALGANISTAATAGGTTVDLASASAAPGERPAGAIGRSVSGTVTIVSAKPDGSAVTFYRDDGLMRVLEVQRPEARDFVSKLKEGDKVDITYTEAVAVNVEPAPAGGTPP